MNKNGMKGVKREGTEEERGRRWRGEEKREREGENLSTSVCVSSKAVNACHIQRGLNLQTVELIWGMKSNSDSPKGP